MRRLAVLLGCVMYILLSVCAGNGTAPALAVEVGPALPWVGNSAEGREQDSRSPVAGGVFGTRADVTVRVRDEAGVASAGAKVYHNGRYVGRTSDEGFIAAEDVMMGDQLAALHQVYEHGTAKGDHDLDGSGNWAWRVYQTNVRIADDGRPELFRVEDVSIVQDLVVRQEQPLVGFHVLACLEWDADPSYLAELRQGLEKASALLYDVGDGQFLWEVIEISDDRVHWADCDLHILASNQEWPRAYVRGISQGKGSHIIMGRHYDCVSSGKGRWTWDGAAGAIVHEFGHYGLGLHDEYLDARGDALASQSPDPDATSEDAYASIMRDPFHPSELGSRMDPHYPHDIQSLHHAKTNGESPWETVLRRFRDPVNPARWTLRSPVERGAIVQGPDAIPVGDWIKVHVNDQDTGACPTFRIEAAYTESGAAARDAEVWVEHASSSLPALRQGKTDQWGAIVIYGAHPGDTVIVRKGRSSAEITVKCSRVLSEGWDPALEENLRDL
jgi:hypothetical protein